MAWLSTSSPVHAATAGGTVRVFSGSSPERRLQTAVRDTGLGLQLAIVKNCDAGCPLPVPAVVGSAMSGFSGPGGGRPPDWGFT
jgi:hypothetical protein